VTKKVKPAERRLEIIYRDPFDLTPDPRNARTHSPEQIEQLRASIREFGFTNPVLLRPDGMIGAGHGRVEAAKAEKLALVPTCVVEGLTDDQWRAYVLADNKLALNAGWDEDLLREELRALDELEINLGSLGFDDAELADLFKTTEGATDPDDTPEPPADPVSRLGDVWLLGDHRIRCGDSTEAEGVEALMGEVVADVCLTDPPYGLGDTKSAKNNYDTHVDTRDGLVDLIAGFLPIAKARSRVVVLTPGNANQRLYPAPTWTMAWFTPAGVGSGPWGFCCWQPILCFGKDPKLAKGNGRAPDAIVHTEGAEKNGHPCAKPINFWAWLLERVSETGDAVYEPFSGSGTTIIAAEMTGRRCYAMELSPAYVDVAVRRWEEFVGRTATLEATGQTFRQVAEERGEQEAA
jgi:hypothetical protein